MPTDPLVHSVSCRPTVASATATSPLFRIDSAVSRRRFALCSSRRSGAEAVQHAVSDFNWAATVNQPLRKAIAVVCLLGLLASQSPADWPQILGPNRDGHAIVQIPLATDWPKSLEPLWSAEVGSGYGGAAIRGSTVFVLDRVVNDEQLICLDLASGKENWRVKWPATYQTTIDPDNGPRCVPTLQGDYAICYGAAGDLVCVHTTDKKIVWSRPLRKEFKADDGYFGAGSSPIVVGDKVIVNVGGSKAGIVAVYLATGKNAWTATTYDASYAAPIALKNKGKSGSPLVLVVTRLKTVLLDSGDGSVIGEVNFGSRGPTVNAAIPIEVAPGQFLLTASYGIGSTLLKLEKDKLVEVYRGDKLLSSQYNSPLKIGDRVIGVDGREDGGPATLRAFDPVARKAIWAKPGLPTSHLIGLAEQVLVVSVDGSVQLIDAKSAEFRALATSQLPAGAYRSLPAFSNNTLVVRRTMGPTSGQLVAIQFK